MPARLPVWMRERWVQSLGIPGLGVALLMGWGKPLASVDEGAMARFFALDEQAALLPVEQDAALGVVRDQLQALSTGALEGVAAVREAPADPPSSLPDRFGLKDLRPVWVTLTARGLPSVKGMASGPTLYRALRAATRAALSEGGAAALVEPGARVGIQVDLFLDQSTLLTTWPPYLNQALEPGVDGLHLRGAGVERWLLPSTGLGPTASVPAGLSVAEGLLWQGLAAVSAEPMPTSAETLATALSPWKVERFRTQRFGSSGPDRPRTEFFRGWPRASYARLNPGALTEAGGRARRWLLEAVQDPGQLFCWLPFDPGVPARACEPAEAAQLRWLLAELVGRTRDSALAVALERLIAHAGASPVRLEALSFCQPPFAQAQKVLLQDLLRLEDRAVKAAAEVLGGCETLPGLLCSGGVLAHQGGWEALSVSSRSIPGLLEAALALEPRGAGMPLASRLGETPSAHAPDTVGAERAALQAAVAARCASARPGAALASWCLWTAVTASGALQLPHDPWITRVLSGRYPPIQPPFPDLLGLSRAERARMWGPHPAERPCGPWAVTSGPAGSSTADDLPELSLEQAQALLLEGVDPVSLALEGSLRLHGAQGQSVRPLREAILLRGRQRLLQQVTEASSFLLPQPERFEGALRGMPGATGVSLLEHTLGMIELHLAASSL